MKHLGPCVHVAQIFVFRGKFGNVKDEGLLYACMYISFVYMLLYLFIYLCLSLLKFTQFLFNLWVLLYINLSASLFLQLFINRVQFL